MLHILQIVTLAAVGGILGILMMVPLRRALIVKEHGQLPVSGGLRVRGGADRGRTRREWPRRFSPAFWTALSTCSSRTSSSRCGGSAARSISPGPRAPYKNATLNERDHARVSGVGYIIGPRISGIMVSGGVLSWLASFPLLSMLVPEETIKADLLKLGFTQGWMDANRRRQTGSTGPTSATSAPARSRWPGS